MIRIITLFAVLYISSHLHLVNAQKQISFVAEDGLEIIADLYVKDRSYPFILLFHQSESARGEYKGIANKLLNLNYNCLAVDLRHGAKMNHTLNQTALNAEKKNYATAPSDALKDINASIDYVFRQYQQPVILFGSVFSASLAMVAAVDNYKVQAVVAFSPGEYFKPRFAVKEKIISLDIPLFIAGSSVEEPYINEMVDSMDNNNRLTTYFLPEKNNVLGAKVLWDDHKNSQKYWFELFVFFKDLKKI
ncbi:MAG: hypothetical protein GVY19_05160 [Bacteroidetes bacterium]|nr:hypothetical protein [Bacteroidota bacterium]